MIDNYKAEMALNSYSFLKFCNEMFLVFKSKVYIN